MLDQSVFIRYQVLVKGLLDARDHLGRFLGRGKAHMHRQRPAFILQEESFMPIDDFLPMWLQPVQVGSYGGIIFALDPLSLRRLQLDAIITSHVDPLDGQEGLDVVQSPSTDDCQADPGQACQPLDQLDQPGVGGAYIGRASEFDQCAIIIEEQP